MIIAIDPGLQGAVACVEASDYDGVWDIPVVGGRVDYDGLCKLIPKLYGVSVIIEELSINPKFGMKALSQQARNYGLIEGACHASGLPFEHVRPQVWRKGVGLPKGADKEVSRRMALELFPHLRDRLSRKKDHNRAEALLIGHWARTRGVKC